MMLSVFICYLEKRKRKKGEGKEDGEESSEGHRNSIAWGGTGGIRKKGGHRRSEQPGLFPELARQCAIEKVHRKEEVWRGDWSQVELGRARMIATLLILTQDPADKGAGREV